MKLFLKKLASKLLPFLSRYGKKKKREKFSQSNSTVHYAWSDPSSVKTVKSTRKPRAVKATRVKKIK